jgi:hypothetical protein
MQHQTKKKNSAILQLHYTIQKCQEQKNTRPLQCTHLYQASERKKYIYMMSKFSSTQSYNLLKCKFILLDGEEHGNMASKRPCFPKTLNNSREPLGQKKMWLFKDTQYKKSKVPPKTVLRIEIFA